MRLLITRPEPDASRTAARLRELGHEVLVQPLLTVSFNDPPANLPNPGAILVTSQNAVRALARWPQVTAWRDVPIFAAGPATGRAALALGFTDVRTGAGDAGSLADVVISTLPKAAGPLIYPAARDRVGTLSARLIARGYDVRTVEAYRADPVERLDREVRDALAAGTVDGVLLYSRRTAEALVDLATAAGIADSLGGPAYYVISENVAAIVGGLGTPVHIAQNPDEDSLLALVAGLG